MTPKADPGSPSTQGNISRDLTATEDHRRSDNSIDKIPLLDQQSQDHTAADGAAAEGLRERK